MFGQINCPKSSDASFVRDDFLFVGINLFLMYN